MENTCAFCASGKSWFAIKRNAEEDNKHVSEIIKNCLIVLKVLLCYSIFGVI